MDSKFLEFYGRFLLNAAKSQKQFEKLSDWINKGFKGLEVEGMEELFRSCYGIAGSQKDSSHENERFKEAMDTFRSSFSSYVQQMGWVPAKEHNDLKSEYEKLQKQVEGQQIIIEQLNNILGITNDMGHGEFFQQMQRLGKKQSDQLRDLMQAFQQAFGTTDKTSD